jgi:hypothetical protein
VTFRLKPIARLVRRPALKHVDRTIALAARNIRNPCRHSSTSTARLYTGKVNGTTPIRTGADSNGPFSELLCPFHDETCVGEDEQLFGSIYREYSAALFISTTAVG